MCEEFMDLMLTPDDRDIVEFAGSLSALILMKRSFYLYPPSTREQAPTSSCIMIVVGRKGIRANHLAFCCALYLFVTSEGHTHTGTNVSFKFYSVKLCQWQYPGYPDLFFLNTISICCDSVP